MILSASLEEYLNAIYQLEQENKVARVTDIAKKLNVKKSSTNKALNILKTEKLIRYEKYQDISLTGIGKKMAQQLEKRSQLFQRFLMEILGVKKELAVTEAQQLSHCISCHTTARLEQYIQDIFDRCQNEDCILKKRGRENEWKK